MLMLLLKDDYADNVSIFIRGKRMTLKSEKEKVAVYNTYGWFEKDMLYVLFVLCFGPLNIAQVYVHWIR